MGVRVKLSRVTPRKKEEGYTLETKEKLQGFYEKYGVESATPFPIQKTKRFPGCSAAITSCVIGANGRIRPCPQFQDEFDNAFEVGLEEAWDSLKTFSKNIRLPLECRGCGRKNSCRGGCRFASLIVNGSVNSRDPLCDTSFKKEKPETLPEILLDAKIIKTKAFQRPEKFGGIIYKKQTLIPLNETAWEAWKICDQKSVSEISEYFEEKYGVNRKKVAEDLTPVFARLAKTDCITLK